MPEVAPVMHTTLLSNLRGPNLRGAGVERAPPRETPAASPASPLATPTAAPSTLRQPGCVLFSSCLVFMRWKYAPGALRSMDQKPWSWSGRRRDLLLHQPELARPQGGLGAVVSF